MANRNDKLRSNSKKSRPYCMVGADRLSAAIWKHGDEVGGFRYQFNVFRMLAENGRVSQLFAPEDVLCLVKLANILALALIDDGCIDADLKRRLQRIVIQLSSLVHETNPNDRVELVAVTQDVLSAIRSIADDHYRDQDGFEEAPETNLTVSVEEVRTWLRGLGYGTASFKGWTRHS